MTASTVAAPVVVEAKPSRSAMQTTIVTVQPAASATEDKANSSESESEDTDSESSSEDSDSDDEEDGKTAKERQLRAREKAVIKMQVNRPLDCRIDLFVCAFHFSSFGLIYF